MFTGKTHYPWPFSIATVNARNPAPVDRWFIPLFRGFIPSKVVQDFFHPQYVTNYQRVNPIKSH